MLLLTSVVWLLALCTVSLVGARPPKSRVPLRTPVPYVILHHTAGNRCYTPASPSRQRGGIQNYHMDYQRWPDIGYTFLIGEDGRVYEGRGWSTMGAHAKNWNQKSLGFSFLGNFSKSPQFHAPPGSPAEAWVLDGPVEFLWLD
ncbi:Peptidoglycan-recognition protein SC2 [Chelonia mydas]|uniref:Peptidoglycan-recognition protein SC2 n=1 Tax=Chelonia mydas TaxID=8469 RepID=M7AL80_CHEMY|nr:Peptidoglycan-recognition protein SC2 [Chelonia mydas]